MLSLTSGRWVGQNSGPIFRRLWTKLHRIKFACAGVRIIKPSTSFNEAH